MKLEEEICCRMMGALAHEVRPDQKVFGVSQDRFRQLWHAALQRLGLSWIGPPHMLRHGGPSFDSYTNRRSLEDIRRRGRWSQIKSVQRYAKAHALTLHYSRLPAELKMRGRQLMIDLHHRIRDEISNKHPWSAALCQALAPMCR